MKCSTTTEMYRLLCLGPGASLTTSCGKVDLMPEEYVAQLELVNRGWRCPICKAPAVLLEPKHEV